MWLVRTFSEEPLEIKIKFFGGLPWRWKIIIFSGELWRWWLNFSWWGTIRILSLKIKEHGFLLWIYQFFLAYPWILGGLACMIFVLGRIESTTLSLWRDKTGKDEKWFPIESRTLKERFLGDFVGGTLWIGLAKVVILERRLKAKKKKKIGEEIMIVCWILEWLLMFQGE